MSERAEVLESTARRLFGAVRRDQVDGRLPSLVAGVVRDGALVWWGTSGAAVARSGGLPATEATQYRIGSITKTMTALLVLQLRDEGAVALSDRLDVHLPDAPYGERTLLELMSHMSGMPAEPPGPWWERSAGQSWDALVGGVDRSASAVAPGSQFHYSNLAYALLGEVVSRLRGEPWRDVLRARLLDPLGMRRTTYLPEAPAASGFSVHPFAGTLTDEPSHDALALAPAGQVWSTVADLASYAAFLADPDPAVVAPDTVREMTVVHTGTPDDALAGGYGLGLRVAVADGRTYVGHTGSMPGFLAGLFVDRARKTGAVCLANGTSGLRAQALPLDLLGNLEECEPTLPSAWEPVGSLPPGVEDLLGPWYWGNTAFALSYDGGELVSRMLGSGERWCSYRPDGVDRLTGTSGYHTGETMRVHRRGDGSISHLECATFVFTREPYDPEAPVPGR